MKIKEKDVIGITAAPDGKYFANLEGFRQVEITKAFYDYLAKVFRVEK